MILIGDPRRIWRTGLILAKVLLSTVVCAVAE